MKRQILAIVAAITLAASANVTFAADAAAGKAKAATCGGCHGANGVSAAPNFPNLAGQKAGYLVKQMKAFKDGTRKEPMMAPMMAPLSDAGMANIAAHYAGMK